MLLKFQSDLAYQIRLLSQAQSYTGTDRGEVNSMIASLEDSRRQAEKEAEETEVLLAEARQVKEDLE